MSTYYIESPDGKYFSEDKKRRFIKLSGKEAFKFLNSPEYKGKYFYKLNEPSDEKDLTVLFFSPALSQKPLTQRNIHLLPFFNVKLSHIIIKEMLTFFVFFIFVFLGFKCRIVAAIITMKHLMVNYVFNNLFGDTFGIRHFVIFY